MFYVMNTENDVNLSTHLLHRVINDGKIVILHSSHAIHPIHGVRQGNPLSPIPIDLQLNHGQAS